MAPRGKIVLARMANDSKKRNAIKKRTDGLLAKMEQVTVMCGAEAAMVIYDPEKKKHTVYPKETEKAKATILKYMSMNGTERMTQTETAKTFFEQKRRKKMAKAKMWTEKAEKLSGQLILTMIADGKLRSEELDSEQKRKVKTFLAAYKAQVVCQIQKKEKEREADGLNEVVPQAPLLAGPPPPVAAGGAQSAMLSAEASWPYLPEQVEAMSATELLQEALQDDAVVPDARSNQKAKASLLGETSRMDVAGDGGNSTSQISTTDKQMTLAPFNNIAHPVPPISLGGTRNGNFGGMNQYYRPPFSPLPLRPFRPQWHQLNNPSWMPQNRISSRHPQNQLPLLHPQLQPSSTQWPPMPHQLRPSTSQLPPQLEPTPTQWLPLPPQSAPAQLPPQSASAQLPPLPLLPPQLRLASALPTQLRLASAQLPPQLRLASAQLPPQPEPVSSQLPPQLEPESSLLPPLPPQLELWSHLPPEPQVGLVSHDFFPARLRGQPVPLSPQLPPHPHQLVPRPLELFPPPSHLQIRGNTNMRLDAPTLRGFANHGAVNKTSKEN